jgi:four helix bundle protein
MEGKKSGSRGYKDLFVYQKAYKLAMRIFEISKKFPREETYSLTDQIRRSSRSVCANIGEAYRKRIYPKHFVSKLSDSDGECTETMIHLDFALDCGYLNTEEHAAIANGYAEVGRMLNGMMNNPEKFSVVKLPTATATKN